MDKPLSDKDKNGQSPAADEKVSASADKAGHRSGSEIGAYATHNSYTQNLTSKDWEDGKGKRAWMDDPVKRIAFRTLTRGILGAAFFAAGGAMVSRSLNGSGLQKAYDPAASLSEQLPFTKEGNWLKSFSYVIDKVVGWPIQTVVGGLAGKEWGSRAVNFRQTNFNSGAGRSLGAETVAVTWDFFLASIGDAWGRDIVGFFDPNTKKAWRDEKGNLSVSAAVKNSFKAVTRYITWNGGEDWGAALPYVYFMKAQRGIINHFSPGWIYDFDRGLNGGSFKIDQGRQVTGSFALEGIIDLQSRFTVYNIFTLAYRELFTHIQDKLAGRQSALYGDPTDEKNQKKGVIASTVDFGKWMLRSAIKGGLYMTPVVPFFWVTRVNQSKQRGLFINDQNGFLSYVDKAGNPQALHAMDSYESNKKGREIIDIDQPIFWTQYHTTPGDYGDPSALPSHFEVSGSRGSNTPRANPGQYEPDRGYEFHPFQQGEGWGAQAGNKIARWQYDGVQYLDKPFAVADGALGAVGDRVKRFIGLENKDGTLKSFAAIAPTFGRAAISYTPYMIAKAESAHFWDNAKMDIAAERTIDGITRLNFNEFASGISEIGAAILHRPLADPEREATAKYRTVLDRSAADVFSSVGNKPGTISWKERMVTSTPTQQEKSKEEISFAERVGKSSEKYTQHEEARQVLATVTPPSSAIH